MQQRSDVSVSAEPCGEVVVGLEDGAGEGLSYGEGAGEEEGEVFVGCAAVGCQDEVGGCGYDVPVDHVVGAVEYGDAGGGGVDASAQCPFGDAFVDVGGIEFERSRQKKDGGRGVCCRFSGEGVEMAVGGAYEGIGVVVDGVMPRGGEGCPEPAFEGVDVDVVEVGVIEIEAAVSVVEGEACAVGIPACVGEVDVFEAAECEDVAELREGGAVDASFEGVGKSGDGGALKDHEAFRCGEDQTVVELCEAAAVGEDDVAREGLLCFVV